MRLLAKIAVLGCTLALGTAATVQAAAVEPIGTGQRTLVICVRYTDALTTRMAHCSDWVSLLNTETDNFYNQATFNQTNFQFETISGTGAPADGWLDLGYASSGYEFSPLGQDAIDLADPYADFSNYNRVLVITNWPGFGGTTSGGPSYWRVGEGAEATVTPAAGGAAVPSRLMTLSITSEWLAHSYGNSFDEGASVMAHELGHQLGARTHYGDLAIAGGGSRDTITPWGIMGRSPTLNHFLGYPKTERGWIPSGPRIVTVGPPTTLVLDQTVTLRPLEQTTGLPQVIRIPFTMSGPFIGYMVENRRKIQGDENLPSQGVLLSAVDDSPNSVIHAFVLEDPSAPLDLNQAPLEVGKTFTDAARNLSVTVVSQSGNNYDVRVQYAPPTTSFDPAITPWGAPPWETADIWIDSPRNMFDTYLYTDGSGHPIGNGDDAWVDHDNRVYVRVHNYGSGVATNVRVQVYVNSPPGMGDAGPNWDFIGTILLPSIAPSGEASGFVIWKPTVGAHTCVKAVILDTPGELTTSNNLAQENVTHFDTSAGSPYQPVNLDASVYNPFDADLPVHIHVRDVPYGWAVTIDPPQMHIPPRGRHPVHVTVYPSGLPPHTEDGSPATARGTTRTDCPPPVKWDPERLRETMRVGFIGKPKVEAQMPFYDTFVPIGGIDLWTHLVHRTELTCRVGDRRRPERRPPFPAASHAGLLPRPQKGQYEERTPGRKPRIEKLDPTAIHHLAPIVREPEPEPRVRAGKVVIEGQLTPAVGGALVALELTHGETRRLLFAKTDEKGRYAVEVKTVPGHTVAQAFFEGDATRGEARSAFCPFVVVQEGD